MSMQLPEHPLERGAAEKEAVAAQLERVLEHSSFRGSVRSAKFLRYVVEYWLEDERQEEPLKERTIGVALFGLDSDYDTSQTTIVRNTAVDVRKRLFVYYHEPEHADEIQIALPVGSYIPQIHLAEQKSQETETVATEPHNELADENGSHPDTISQAPAATPKQIDHRRLLTLCLIVLVAVAAGTLGGIMMGRHRSTPLVTNQGDLSSDNLFLQPVLAATPPDPVILVCVGQLSQAVNGQQVTPIGNAFAIAAITRLLDTKGAKSRLDIANSITQEQLRLSTVILIGGMDNPLVLDEQNGLRFRIASQRDRGASGTAWIEDRNNPGKRVWLISSPSQNSEELIDYAILARAKDPGSGQWRVFASGLNDIGTYVASEMLAVPGSLQQMTKRFPAGWTSRNVEMVIQVKIVAGKPGYPQLVAYEIW